MKLVKNALLPWLEAAFHYRDAGLRLQVRELRRRLPAAQILISAVSSLHDSPGGPNDFLLKLATDLITECRGESLSLLHQRNAPGWVFNWPGEHYRLLASAVSVLRPLRIVEIGTNTGLSALAMRDRMPPSSRLWTFDIVPWNQLRERLGCEVGSFLRDSDFEDGTLCQVIGDLASKETFSKHCETLQQADLIFVDGPKDGQFEAHLLRNFEYFGLRDKCLIIFDDIRYWTMLDFWRGVTRPKLDITSFGHFSGTGLVSWE